ncbi:MULTISPECIES: triple tyrosine motif-containing protein [unclassified Wenzhouxiangella]|uniref:triple tyrosine motif-containing protein n=1 Tax=unclassified Wenzhouxiangella TaxID=2613841 RepID=UPI000E32A4E2|nr:MULTISPECIES: triple tyrosine motif-containing protein [unclassified Wenzhouxiangella]RFF26976.1 diguanylate cyclase [Wenzhouxiangella sp. 15181]RFP69488.1 diguanylate cyclase [Wenzhouxiangella sp. 15190]
MHREIGLLEPFAGLDASLPYARELRLDHRQRIFALRMVALDFNAPSAARLRYRVEGLHDDWVQVNGAQAEFSVNYLAPGSYRLRIEAAGRDGRFGNQSELTMVLTPPLWLHPVAYALYGVLLVMLLALIVWRVRRNMHYKRRQVEILHRQVAKRTAELEILNEKLHHSNRRLDRFCRQQDILVRWGGEEFLLVANGVEPAMGAGLADRALYAAKAAGKNGWYGLLPGPRARSDSLDQLSPGKPLSDLIKRDILEAVSSSTMP